MNFLIFNTLLREAKTALGVSFNKRSFQDWINDRIPMFSFNNDGSHSNLTYFSVEDLIRGTADIAASLLEQDRLASLNRVDEVEGVVAHQEPITPVVTAPSTTTSSTLFSDPNTWTRRPTSGAGLLCGAYALQGLIYSATGELISVQYLRQSLIEFLPEDVRADNTENFEFGHLQHFCHIMLGFALQGVVAGTTLPLASDIPSSLFVHTIYLDHNHYEFLGVNSQAGRSDLGIVIPPYRVHELYDTLRASS